MRRIKNYSESSGRSIKGGQIGQNGYFYKGGQFLPSTDNPPGTFRFGNKIISNNIKELIEPGIMELPPTPTSRSIFAMIRGETEYHNKDTLFVNPRINWEYMNSSPDKENIFPGIRGVKSKNAYSLNQLVDLYNKGARWLDLDFDLEEYKKNIGE